MENIAILTISTGDYTKLLPELIGSVENFLPSHRKQIFVFTDQYNEIHDGVTKIKISHLPWPLTTLLRFYYFNNIMETLKEFDVIYYMDCDMIINQRIDEEILPNEDEIVVVKHYWQQNAVNMFETNNLNSKAYIDFSSLNCVPEYYQGCFYGAKKDQFIQMISILSQNVMDDLKNNIIAKWHDESHLNKYVLTRNKKILDSTYAYPATEFAKKICENVKILHKNANTFYVSALT